MYHSTESHRLEFLNFYLPFSGNLDSNNRWVQLARLVPCELAQSPTGCAGNMSLD